MCGFGSKSGRVAVITSELTQRCYEAQRKTHFSDVYLWFVSFVNGTDETMTHSVPCFSLHVCWFVCSALDTGK